MHADVDERAAGRQDANTLTDQLPKSSLAGATPRLKQSRSVWVSIENISRAEPPDRQGPVYSHPGSGHAELVRAVVHPEHGETAATHNVGVQSGAVAWTMIDRRNPTVAQP